jgi:hypothetical protein
LGGCAVVAALTVEAAQRELDWAKYGIEMRRLGNEISALRRCAASGGRRLIVVIYI